MFLISSEFAPQNLSGKAFLEIMPRKSSKVMENSGNFVFKNPVKSRESQMILKSKVTSNLARKNFKRDRRFCSSTVDTLVIRYSDRRLWVCWWSILRTNLNLSLNLFVGGKWRNTMELFIIFETRVRTTDELLGRILAHWLLEKADSYTPKE